MPNREENDVSYRERPFSDLVDEDKHELVGRKILASLLGGYRLVINDYDEDRAPCGLLLAQLLIYTIIPMTTVIGAIAVPDDKWVAMVVGGAIAFVFNVIFMLVSKMMK